MIIRLNRKSHACLHYMPPIPVTRYFDDVDTDAPANQQIEQLLWIPALLVARFHGQFPILHSELDELFSIGLLTVCEVVNGGGHSGSKIGGVIHVACVRAMEDYANDLNSIVKVGTTTRYKNHKRGIETPVHGRLTVDQAVSADMTEIMIRDAAESIGLRIGDLDAKQKRRLYEALS